MSEREWNEELGLRIRRARRAKDITQSQLAKTIGAYSASFICDIEKGRKSLPVYSLYLLERTLGPLWIGAK